MSLLLTLKRFQTFFYCFHYWLWTSKYRLGKCFECLQVQQKKQQNCLVKTLYANKTSIIRKVTLEYKMQPVAQKWSLYFKISTKFIHFRMVSLAFHNSGLLTMNWDFVWHFTFIRLLLKSSRPHLTFTCSKSRTEALEKGVKYVQT